MRPEDRTLLAEAARTTVVHRSGHVGAALAAYAPVAFVTAAVGLDTLALLGALAAVGLSSLPDVDHRLPLVSHRGPTHTVWFTLAVAAAGGYVGWTAGVPAGPAQAMRLAAFGATVSGLAVGSHVAVDALTPAGIRPLAPLSNRWVCFNLTPAGSPLANWLGLVVGSSLAAVAFALGRQFATVGAPFGL